MVYSDSENTSTDRGFLTEIDFSQKYKSLIINLLSVIVRDR